jgi:hypothetical protein
VVNRVVFHELLAELRLSGGLIGHDVSFAGYISANDWRNVLFLDSIDMERTSRTTALNESHDYMLVIFSLFNLDALLTADESLINLNNRAVAALGATAPERIPSRMRRAINQTVRYEPKPNMRNH